MSTLRMRGRRSAILPTLIIAAVLVVAFAIFTNFWTDRLWFTSFDYGEVFSIMLLTRIGLFAAFGLIMGVVVAANATIAHRMRPRGIRPAGPRNAMLDRYRDLLDARFVWIVVALSVVVGLFAGGAAAGQLETYLAWQNSTPFGKLDPQFNIDIGFFVFDYPWWRFVLSFVFAVLCFAAVAVAVVYYVTGALRFSGPARGGSAAAQAQLSILVGLAVLVKGVSYWFDRYGLGISNNVPLFTGISYTSANATLNAKLILAIIGVICALLFFANAVLRRWVVPTIGLTLMLLSAIVLGVVYPGAVQYFSVRPDEPDKERPYIAKNIAATRAAYGVDGVQIEQYKAETETDAGQLSSDAAALPGIRLIDPSVIAPAYEQLQQVRGYYSFPKTLDVDRYKIDNKETDAVVAVREIDQDGIEGKNWNNLKTVYTHGYGIVAAYGNQRQTNGSPQWIPATGPFAKVEPRVYFGEIQDDYSIVGAPAGTAPIELDAPRGPTVTDTYTYAGKGGVPIGNIFNRLLYAAKFGDVNILLSDRVNDSSKIIYDRSPRDRVQKAAPWLKVDSDIYPAVVDGRIVWIVDGYTTSDSYPYSQRTALEQSTSDTATSTQTNVVAQQNTMINYMRNSVKAVVDAYDGTVKLYAWDETDPVLKTWRKAFPSAVLDRSAISPDLLQHMRYPQDLYRVQRNILTKYHMTDPNEWYQQARLWEIPNDPTAPANAPAREAPNYLSIKWPGEDDAIFSLTSVYVPKGRSNLAAYMAVNADASSPEYGKLRMLQFDDTSQIDGPAQSANAMLTNTSVQDRLRPFQAQNSSTLIYGNLLTLPLGGGLLYVQPVYAQRQGSGGGAYPALIYVMVRFGQAVGIGDTLQVALDQAFKGNAGITTGEGNSGGGTPTGGGTGTGTQGNAAATKALEEAQTAFAAADQALADKDLAKYQAQMKLAQAAVLRAEKALGG